jgi:hypothetical protein
MTNDSLIFFVIFEVYQSLTFSSKLTSMDITATLNEIATLIVEDRIRLVQAIWDSIAAEQVYPDLTDAQKQELDRRLSFVISKGFKLIYVS